MMLSHTAKRLDPALFLLIHNRGGLARAPQRLFVLSTHHPQTVRHLRYAALASSVSLLTSSLVCSSPWLH